MRKIFWGIIVFTIVILGSPTSDTAGFQRGAGTILRKFLDCTFWFWRIQNAFGGAELMNKSLFDELSEIVAESALIDGHKTTVNLVEREILMIFDQEINFFAAGQHGV